MRDFRRFAAIPFLAYLLAAFTDQATVPAAKRTEASTELELFDSIDIPIWQVKRVVRGVNTDGERIISILLGSSDCKLFDVSILRSNFREGYTVQSHSYNHSEIMMRAGWHGDRFVQSTKHPTVVSLTIQSITAKEAVFFISGTLVNPVTGNYITLPPSVFKVYGTYFKALLGKR